MWGRQCSSILLSPADSPRTQEIFIWKDVPASEIETRRLYNFLEQRFNLTWLEHASIIKSDHSLWIRYRANFISIELDLDKEAATMKIKEQRKQSEYQLAVRAISPDFLSVRAPIMPIKANAAHYLLLSTQQHIPSFLFGLASKVLPGSSEFEILSRVRSSDNY